MTIYVMMLAIFAAGAIFVQKGNRTEKVGIPFYAAITAATLVVGFRWQIGPDWATYAGIYERLGSTYFSRTFDHDPSFYALGWLLRYLDAPYWMLNLVMGAILLFGTASFCKTLPNPWLAAAVAMPYLIIVVGMNLIRQGAAMGFVFLALRHVGSKALWKSFAWVIVAATFHASALIVAPFIAVSYSKNRLVAGAVLILALPPTYYMLSGTFDEYFDRYSRVQIDSVGVYFRLVINAVPAVLLLLLRNRNIVPPDEYRLWRNVAIASILVLPLPMFVYSTTPIDRASIYAIPLQLMVLSALPHVVSREGDRTVNTAVILIYSFLTLIVYFGFGKYAIYYVPYHWIFGK